jgi:DNA invertase Pin-like site-specific DNA recombinase
MDALHFRVSSDRQTTVNQFAGFENSERSEAIRAGQTRARAAGKRLGRPETIFRRDLVPELRARGFSWREIARRTGGSVRTIRRVQQVASERAYPVAKVLEGHPDERPG